MKLRKTDRHRWKHIVPIVRAVCLLSGAVSIIPANTVSAQTVGNQVAGLVTDTKGEPLPGTTVHLKGSSTGTVTNAEGRYTLSVNSPDAILVFTAVGYKAQEWKADNKTTLDIKLEADATGLNEVLVVGYGTQRRGDVLGAVSSFNAKNIEEKPVARIEQALIGQMPGVQVRQQTGMPGSALSIQVRGAGSITAGNEPLYVVDGFPLDISSQNSDGGVSNSPLNSLNPNDIESVQVLKDAAAAAIYGSRAANGVVIITTKRGQNGKMKINANVKTGVSQVAKKLDLLSADEWVAMATEVANTNWVNSGAGRTAAQTNAQRDSILKLAPGTINTTYMADPRWSQPGHPGLTYVDWQDEVFRKAAYQNYELSANGGTENVKYFISGNYLNQNGTIINSGFRNYGLRANVEANASKKIKLGINFAPSYSVTNAPPAEGKDNQLMKLAQMVPVVESDAGLNTGASGNPTYTWSSARLISPYAFLQAAEYSTKSTRTLGSIYGEYQVIPGLALRSVVNYDGTDNNIKNYIPDYVTVGAAAALATNPGLYSSGTYTTQKKQNFLNENTLSYNKAINPGNHIAAVAGVSYNVVHFENVRLATAGGYANNIVTTLNNAIANSAGVTYTGTNTETNSTMLSYYGRVQYDYREKYLFSGTVRRDASSRFGPKSRWGNFPSASVGWRISKEDFLKNVTQINDLKLRASWGKSGNNNIGDYSAISTITGSTYSFGGNTPASAVGQVLASLADSNLKWETSNTWNVGVDATLFNGRVNLIVDIYRKRNTDLLLNLPVLAASGFSTSLQNIGAVVNKGLEISLNTVNVRTASGFQWTMNTNIAFNKNTVAALGPDHEPIEIASAYSGSNAPYLLKEGLPAYSFYVTKVIGVLTEADMGDASVAKLKNQTVGDARYQDTDGNGIIDAKDRVVYGHPNPDYTWGWTNTFKYKDFDLSILVYGQHGGSILSYFGRAIDFSGSTTANVLGIWRDRWTTENQDANAPRGKFGSTYTVPYVTSDWVYSTDFIRIQNITLGYNLNRLFRHSKTVSTARVFASVENLFTKDKYKGGVNPEAQNTNFSGNGSYSIPGDYGAMPLSRTYSFGATVGF